MASYCECVVKRKEDPSRKTKEMGLLAGAVFGVIVAFLFFIPALILTIGCVVGYVIYHRGANAEYEYIVVGDELRVETVFNQSRRKRTGSYVLANVERALVTSQMPDVDTSRWASDVVDYTSGEEGDDTVKMLVKVNGNPRLLILTASEKLVSALKQETPARAWKEFMWR